MPWSAPIQWQSRDPSGAFRSHGFPRHPKHVPPDSIHDDTRWIVNQVNFEWVSAPEFNHPFDELPAFASQLRPIIEIDQQFVDMSMLILSVLPRFCVGMEDKPNQPDFWDIILTGIVSGHANWKVLSFVIWSGP